MKEFDLLIIGGGPAGLAACINALKYGANVCIVERDGFLGGQLVKQTHKFFGSKEQYASIRGIEIANILESQIKEYEDRLTVMLHTTCLGIYDDFIVTVYQNEEYIKIKPKSIIVATGAMEKVLGFPNNDLPGIYGAGAVQTLMNVYGVKPGDKIVMVGAGNIGLIVSYQLLQAGCEVLAVLDAAKEIGGYLVHASKLRRMGVPILTKHSVKEAIGETHLEKLVVWELDDHWQGIEGTEIEYDADVCCLSVGLTPSSELLVQAGCEMKYVSELGGNVPIISKYNETTVDGIFVAGDISGVEEASSAMVEGYLTGLFATQKLGFNIENFTEKVEEYERQLKELRHGETGVRINQGLAKILRGDHHA